MMTAVRITIWLLTRLEFIPAELICQAGAENCAHGPCVSGDLEAHCCKTAAGKCVVNASEFDWALKAAKQQVIYAIGREIFSLTASSSAPQLIARSSKSNLRVILMCPAALLGMMILIVWWFAVELPP